MIRILLVDDHKVLREALQMALESGGDVRVSATAASSEEGLRKAHESALDAAMIDISLPDRDGFWLLQQLKTSFPSLPVIVLSMNCDDDSVIRAYQNGASGYLSKTVLPGELTEALHNALQGRFYLQARLAASSPRLSDSFQKL